MALYQGFFQCVRRRNSPSGNAYKLVMCYTNYAELHSLVEVQTSLRSSTELGLIEEGYKEITEIVVEPAEYKRIISDYKSLYWVAS